MQVTRARSDHQQANNLLQQTLLVMALVTAAMMGAQLAQNTGVLSKLTASLVYLAAACAVAGWCLRCRMKGGGEGAL